MHWSDEKFIELKKQGFRYAIRPHFPNYVDRDITSEEIFGANTLQEIFNAPYIKSWQKNAQLIMIALDTEMYTKEQRLIRACMKDGSHWVVAYFCELENNYNKQI